jgi:hypothetical protein
MADVVFVLDVDLRQKNEVLILCVLRRPLASRLRVIEVIFMGDTAVGRLRQYVAKPRKKLILVVLPYFYSFK